MAKRHILNTPSVIGRQVDDQGFPGLTFDVTAVARSGRSDMPINYSHPMTRGKYREGGPWFCRFQTRERSSNVVKARWLDRFSYKGQFFPYNPFGEPDWSWLYNSGADLYFLQILYGHGASSLAAMNPAKPDFSAASSLYELRELPSQLQQATRGVIEAMKDAYQRKFSDKRRHISSHSKTAQWHLALTFGWLPILSDIRNFLEARKNLDKRLRQVIRDEGRPVRRFHLIREDVRMDYDYTYYHGTPYNPHLSPSLPVYAYADSGGSTTRVTQQSAERTWAVAQWRYFLPPGPRDGKWTRNMRRRIMGGRITPSALYAVLPWSWLVDYFTDVGNFIEATDNGIADLLYYDYCYVMQTSQVVNHVYATQYMRGVDGPEEVQAHYTSRQGFKARSPGSVFGFRLQADLSARQLGVLGALGFSRLP